MKLNKTLVLVCAMSALVLSAHTRAEAHAKDGKFDFSSVQDTDFDTQLRSTYLKARTERHELEKQYSELAEQRKAIAGDKLLGDEERASRLNEVDEYLAKQGERLGELRDLVFSGKSYTSRDVQALFADAKVKEDGVAQLDERGRKIYQTWLKTNQERLQELAKSGKSSEYFRTAANLNRYNTLQGYKPVDATQDLITKFLSEGRQDKVSEIVAQRKKQGLPLPEEVQVGNVKYTYQKGASTCEQVSPGNCK